MMVAGPTWLLHALAVVMLSTAIYCAGRVIYGWARRRRTEHLVDGMHVAMGVAMAGMLVPAFSTFSTPVWVTVFSIGTVWFVGAAIHCYWAGNSATVGSQIGHVLGCTAMVYMFLAMPDDGRAGMVPASAGSERLPAVAVLLGFGVLGYVWWMGLRLTGLSESVAAGGTSGATVVGGQQIGCGYGAGYLSPRLAACCEVAMGLVMAYPLIGLA
jgi:Domain of unknown function (DUF5134)